MIKLESHCDLNEAIARYVTGDAGETWWIATSDGGESMALDSRVRSEIEEFCARHDQYQCVSTTRYPPYSTSWGWCGGLVGRLAHERKLTLTLRALEVDGHLSWCASFGERGFRSKLPEVAICCAALLAMGVEVSWDGMALAVDVADELQELASARAERTMRENLRRAARSWAKVNKSGGRLSG